MAKSLPIIFGTSRQQDVILEAYLNGFALLRKNEGLARLLSSGLIATTKWQAYLNSGHPAYQELRKLLCDLTGKPGKRTPRKNAGKSAINPERPLGHQGKLVFRVILAFIWKEKQSTDEIRSAISDAWPTSIASNIEILLKDGVIVNTGHGKYSLSPKLPRSFTVLIERIAENLGHSDPRFIPGATTAPQSTGSFKHGSDNAPLLFATAVRLRTLMALAKYGPMNILDLRRCVGGNAVPLEGKDNAPFTRANIVRTWETSDGTNVMLDPQHPLYPPLCRLLLKLEEHYPVLPFQPRYQIPKQPLKLKVWKGDRLALFGGEIPTSILTSIAPMGWTFEALCCSVATGYDRVVVKKSLKRLEADGILQGDRARRPGFNVRVVTIADAFPAKDELEVLLQAYLKQWPQVGKSVQIAMAQLQPRTKEHLRRRGLMPRDTA